MATSVPKSIKASLYIDGKPAENSIKNLTQVTKQLERELNGLTVGTAEWQRKMEQLQASRQHLRNIRDEVNQVGGAFAQIRQELGKVGTLAAGYLGFQFITSQFQNIISSNAKLSDSLADLRRVTGLTEAGVLNLDASLGKIDTRTSKSGLREIAVIAGKLGVAKGQILGFVEATDKLVVALGDELGNADQITTTLGKILNVFEGEVTGDNITRLGNAMVKLANDGVASAGFISDFTQRVSGIAKTAGLSLPATLAFGAGIEELGGRSESAATAMQKLLLSISSDTPKAAKIAGVSVKEFTTLLGKAPEEALLRYTRGLVANKNAFSDVTKSLDDAGEEGARTIETITKLGQNFEFFTGKITDATFAMGGYDEINEAFNLKNQTLGAQLDKLSKDFNSLGTNRTLVNFFTNLVYFASASVKWLKENSEQISHVLKVVVVGTAGWLGYRTALILVNIWTATVSGTFAVLRTASLLLALAKAKLTGDTLRAAAAQKLLNLTMEANPLGIVLALVSALATAYVLFSDKITTAAKIQQDLNNVKVEAAKNSLQEKEYITTLIGVLKNENESRANKLIAVNKLRDIMPAYLKQYSDEEILAGKAVGAIQKYIGALEQKTMAEAAQSLMLKNAQRIIELEKGDEIRDISLMENMAAGAMNMFSRDRSGTKWLAKKLNTEDRDEVASLKAQNRELKAAYGSDIAKNAIGEVATGGTVTSTGGKPDKKAENAAKAATNKALSEFERLDDEYKKLKLQRLNDQLSANEKEVKQEADKYDALLQKERDFLKQLEANRKLRLTAEQKKENKDQERKTNSKILQIQVDQEKAVSDLRVRQEIEMSRQIEELRTKLADVHENELKKQQDQINKFYDDQEVKNAGNQVALNKLKIERSKELSAAEIREKERLEKEKLTIESEYDSLSGSKPAARLAKINKKYDDEITALKAKFSKELQVTKEFQDALKLIEKNRRKEIEVETKATEEDKKNYILDTAQKASDGVFTIMGNNRSAETDRKIKALDREREAELSKTNLTEEQKTKINERFDAKVREAKEKAWKADQAAALAQVVVNGAIAVSKVLAQTGILSPFAIPAIIAGTALQSAIILAQPMPQFAQGGYSDNDPAGYVGQPTVFKKSASGRSFIAGEAGKEWIAPNWMVQSPRYANVIGMLEAARQDKRAFASGGYNASTTSSTPSPSFVEPNTSRLDRLEVLVGDFVTEQRRFNLLPITNVWSEMEDYSRKLNNDRSSQIG